jgi:hypothetical protein
VTAAHPTLRWSASATASRYGVQVLDSGDNVVVDSQTTYLYVTLTTSLPQGSYRWQMRARDAAGSSGYPGPVE